MTAALAHWVAPNSRHSSLNRLGVLFEMMMVLNLAARLVFASFSDRPYRVVSIVSSDGS